MAGMKGFYIGLGALAVGGAGALFLVGGGAAAVPTGPIDMAAIAAARDWGGYVVGDADAPVEIIEYADFECPACRVWWVLTGIDLKRRLVASGRVRFSFRDFPLHQNSIQAHHAAACADEQGMFELMHDKLFDTQNEWTGRAAVERGLALAGRDDCEFEPSCPGVWLQFALGVELTFRDNMSWVFEYHVEDALRRHRLFFGLTSRRGG